MPVIYWNMVGKESGMITERLQRVFDILKDLPPDEQDRLAAAMQRLLE